MHVVQCVSLLICVIYGVRLGFPTFVAAIPYRHHSPPQLLNFFPNSGSGTGGNDDEYVQVADSDNTDCSFPSSVCLQQVHAWSQASHSQVVFAIVNQDGNSKVCSLADSWALLKQSDVAVDVVFCVKDVHGAFLLNKEAGETEATYTPGWGVRNVLAFLAHCLPNTVSSSDRVVKILCIQSHAVPSATPGGGSQGRLCFPLLTVTLPADCLGPTASSGEMPRVVGWQANERGKPGPRVLDAAIVMDTRRIMEQVSARQLAVVLRQCLLCIAQAFSIQRSVSSKLILSAMTGGGPQCATDEMATLAVIGHRHALVDEVFAAW
jgi:hypothetical protein